MLWVNQITYSRQMSRDLRQAVYVVRGDRPRLPQAVAQAVARQDPRIERVSLEPMSAVVQRNLGSRSLAIRLIGAFGGLALRLTTVGISVDCGRKLAGVAAFLPASALLKSQLYGVAAADGVSILAVVLLVLGASRVASWAPSRRAEKTEPGDLLRDA